MIKRVSYMFSALFLTTALVTSYVALTSPARTSTPDDGVLRAKSVYPLPETIVRLKQDIAGKGIMFFSEIDQSKLAAGAGITLRPSVLLTFGNPPLGTQFITSNQNAGLDWPVRLLVFENDKGEVWTNKRYRGARTWLPLVELAFALYYAAAVVVAISVGAYLTLPFLLIFACGFAYVGGLSLLQRS